MFGFSASELLVVAAIVFGFAALASLVLRRRK
jgi:hypothetical protein